MKPGCLRRPMGRRRRRQAAWSMGRREAVVFFVWPARLAREWVMRRFMQRSVAPTCRQRPRRGVAGRRQEVAFRLGLQQLAGSALAMMSVGLDPWRIAEIWPVALCALAALGRDLPSTLAIGQRGVARRGVFEPVAASLDLPCICGDGRCPGKSEQYCGGQQGAATGRRMEHGDSHRRVEAISGAGRPGTMASADAHRLPCLGWLSAD